MAASSASGSGLAEDAQLRPFDVGLDQGGHGGLVQPADGGHARDLPAGRVGADVWVEAASGGEEHLRGHGGVGGQSVRGAKVGRPLRDGRGQIDAGGGQVAAAGG